MMAFALLGCTPQPEPGKHVPRAAWWVDIEFEPGTGTQGRYDARAVDPDWQRMSMLDANMLKGRIADSDLTQFRQSAFSFLLQADLDGDGVHEDFFVGVYETLAGELGRFVAIARNGRVVKHFADAGSAGFSALLPTGDQVGWYACMECDSFYSIRWTGEGYSLE